MAYEKYTIRQFINAWFNNDRILISEEEFSTVYSEYIDTSGLFQSQEFDKITFIHFTNVRINDIKLGIKLQLKFLEEFGVPYTDNFSFFENFGYYLLWNNDKEDFLKQLENVEAYEKQYISQLEIALAELKEIRKTKNNGKPVTEKETRASFIRTINTIGKCGFQVNPDTTTVEEFAHMIKQQIEEAEKLKTQ